MLIPKWLMERYPFLDFRAEGIYLKTEQLRELPSQKMQTVLADLLTDIFRSGFIIRQLSQSLFLLNHATGLEISHLEKLREYHLLGSGLEIFSDRQRQKLKNVKTSKDRYTAYIRIDSTPSSQTVPLDADVLIAHLWLSGVRYGFRASLIKGALAFTNDKVNADQLLRYYQKYDLPAPIQEGVLPIALGKRLVAQECSKQLIWHIPLQNEHVLKDSDPSDLFEADGHLQISSGTVLAECHGDGMHTPGIRVDGKVEIPWPSQSRQELEKIAGEGVTLLETHKGIQKLVAAVDGALYKKNGQFTVIPMACPLENRTGEEVLCEKLILTEEDFLHHPSSQETEAQSHLKELEKANERIVANLHQISEKMKKAAEVLETRQDLLSKAKLKVIETHYQQITLQRNKELSSKARLSAQIRRAKQACDHQRTMSVNHSQPQVLTA